MTLQPQVNSKAGKITYWISTIWLSLGMMSSGTVQLLQLESETKFVIDLGYPEYFITILGIWKILGVLAILVPKLPLPKEWAYAGFFFCMTGAIFSHIAMQDPLSAFFPSMLLLFLTLISWYFRPESRKIFSSGQVWAA